MSESKWCFPTVVRVSAFCCNQGAVYSSFSHPSLFYCLCGFWRSRLAANAKLTLGSPALPWLFYKPESPTWLPGVGPAVQRRRPMWWFARGRCSAVCVFSKHLNQTHTSCRECSSAVLVDRGFLQLALLPTSFSFWAS